jgi:hypothetical protein
MFVFTFMVFLLVSKFEGLWVLLAPQSITRESGLKGLTVFAENGSFENPPNGAVGD